jgi:c-di-GMP-binding flagellar brake protein YcgR
MDNRRANYRHAFAFRENIEVELESALTRTTFAGQLRDLSTGGMKVWLFDCPPPVSSSEPWITRASVPGLARVYARATIVYQQPAVDGACCGVRFLPLADPRATEAREKLIWQYLLEQQRRPIRQRQRESVPSGGGFLRIYCPDS